MLPWVSVRDDPVTGGVSVSRPSGFLIIQTRQGGGAQRADPPVSGWGRLCERVCVCVCAQGRFVRALSEHAHVFALKRLCVCVCVCFGASSRACLRRGGSCAMAHELTGYNGNF